MLSDITDSPIHWVRLAYTPDIIVDEWERAIVHIEQKQGNDKVFLQFPERVLQYTRDEIRILGVRYHREEGEEPFLVLGLVGNNAEKVRLVHGCLEEDDSTVVRYYPVYDNPTVEEEHCWRPQLQTSNYPVTGVGLIIWRYNNNHEREFLMARRSKGPHPYLNRLSNFGGAVDIGEWLAEACVREVFEETNLEFDIEQLEYINFSEDRQAYSDGSQYHAYSHTYAVQVVEDMSPCNMEPHKARNMDWYTESYLRSNPDEMTKLALDSFRIFDNH